MPLKWTKSRPVSLARSTNQSSVVLATFVAAPPSPVPFEVPSPRWLRQPIRHTRASSVKQTGRSLLGNREILAEALWAGKAGGAGWAGWAGREKRLFPFLPPHPLPPLH